MPHRLTAENTVTAETFISMAREKDDAEMKDTASHILDINGRDALGNTPLIACSHWNMKNAMKRLIEMGADLNAINNEGYGAMIYASEYSDPESVRILLAAGADPNAVNSEGWTPLMCACFLGHYDTAEVLLRGGAALDPVNRLSQSVLDIARTRQLESIESLLEKYTGEYNISDDGYGHAAGPVV